jgi:hypothetical protein
MEVSTIEITGKNNGHGWAFFRNFPQGGGRNPRPDRFMKGLSSQRGTSTGADASGSWSKATSISGGRPAMPSGMR